MTCIPIHNGILCFARTDFDCPYCGKQYSDDDEVLLDRVNRNKKGYTTVKCACGKRFGMTYDITGNAVGFKLNTMNK